MFSAASLRINNDIVIFPDNNNNNFEKKDKSNTSSSSSSSSSSSTSCDAASTTFPFFSSLKEPLHERAFKVPIASRIAKFACKSFRQTVELSYVNRNFEDTMKRYHQCYKIIAMNLGFPWVKNELSRWRDFSCATSDGDEDDWSYEDDEPQEEIVRFDRKLFIERQKEKRLVKDLSVPSDGIVKSIRCEIEKLPPLDETMKEVENVVYHLTDLLDALLYLNRPSSSVFKNVMWLQHEFVLVPSDLFQSEVKYDWNVRLRQDPQETLAQALLFLPKKSLVDEFDFNLVASPLLPSCFVNPKSPSTMHTIIAAFDFLFPGTDLEEPFLFDARAMNHVVSSFGNATSDAAVFELVESSEYPVSLLEYFLNVCSNHGILVKILSSRRGQSEYSNHRKEQYLLEMVEDKDKKNLLLHKIFSFINIPRSVMNNFVSILNRSVSDLDSDIDNHDDDDNLLQGIVSSLSVNNLASLIAVSSSLHPKYFTSAIYKIKLLDEERFVEAMQDETILFQALVHQNEFKIINNALENLCKLLSEHKSLKKNLQYQPSCPEPEERSYNDDPEPSSTESGYAPLFLAARDPDGDSYMLRILLLQYSDFGLLSQALCCKTKEGENLISVYAKNFRSKNRNPDSYERFAVAIAAHFSSYEEFRSVVPEKDLPDRAFGNLDMKSIFGTLPPKRKKISGSRRNRTNDDDDDDDDDNSDYVFESVGDDLACHYYEWTHRFCCSGEYFRRK